MKLFEKDKSKSLLPKTKKQKLIDFTTFNKHLYLRDNDLITSLKTSKKKDKIFEFITEINLPKEYGNNLIDNGFDNLDVLIIQTKNGIALTYENGNQKLMAVFIDDLNMQKLDSCLTEMLSN